MADISEEGCEGVIFLVKIDIDILPDRLMVGHRPLEASILVRIQVRQQTRFLYTSRPRHCSFLLYLNKGSVAQGRFSCWSLV